MPRAANMTVRDDDIIVVGSGIAGLVCALALAPRPVTLITKTSTLAGGSSFLAKGGIAAALGPGDSPEAHAKDTVAAGAGLTDAERALSMTADGVAGLQLLLDAGVPFDRTRGGTLHLAREAAHRYARVVHASGDATGEVLVASLIRRVRRTPSVRVVENTFAYDLVVRRGRVHGLITIDPHDGWVFHRSSRVVLATGGIGMAWWRTTNPVEATGDGLAMAARAGARLADLEFMQFHPTALAADTNGDGASLPLLTEALRGAGAWLLDQSGCRFMLEEHAAAELAPRDVVAQAIQRRISSGQSVFLDLRPVFEADKASLFPQALRAAREAGLDPQRNPLPITPAAHYHMGGVCTDQFGRTSLKGLWACGEVATTGVHGANRLASNSLLEGLVYARRVADDVARNCARQKITRRLPSVPDTTTSLGSESLQSILNTTRSTFSEYVGICRSASGLETAISVLSELDTTLRKSLSSRRNGGSPDCKAVVRVGEIRNIVLVAHLVAVAAYKREESRGAHYRVDYPRESIAWQRRQNITFTSTAGDYGS